MNEQEAIAKLKRGDISGLETLVGLYQVKAMHVAHLIVQNRMMAEDVVQSAFLKAFDRIDQFDANRPFGPWFLKSVANDARKAITRQRPQLSFDADENVFDLANLLPDPAPEPLSEVEQRMLCETVTASLAKLSPAQRTAVVMRYYLGLSEREMAEQLDIPRNTVKWRLYAAREKLRAWLRLSEVWR